MTFSLPQLYLDLDRTLFDTSKASVALRVAAEKHFGKYGVTAQLLYDTYRQFTTRVGEQHYYRFFDHLADYGINEDEAEASLRRELAGEDFLFPDAQVFLDFVDTQSIVPIILTFGEKRFQLFKASLAPRLARYPIETILFDKIDYLAERPDDSAILVDDKSIHTAFLPRHCTGVLIDRSQPEAIIKQSDHYIVNNLASVEELL